MKKFRLTILMSAMILVLESIAMPVMATSESGETGEEEYGKAYIKALYSSDITPAEGDVFVITYSVAGYYDTAKITVDASTVTNTTEISMPVADYCVRNIEYQGNNEDIIEQGYGSTYTFSSTPAGGFILYLSIGTEQNNYIDEAYESTFILDDYHSAGPTADPDEGRFDYQDVPESVATSGDAEPATEYEYTTEDIEWDMEYNENYGVEQQIQDGTQKPETEYYQSLDEATEEVAETQEGSEKGGTGGGLIFGIILLVGGGVAFWFIRKKL